MHNFSSLAYTYIISMLVFCDNTDVYKNSAIPQYVETALMNNADIVYNYTLKYMILRQSILSIDKIFKEITVSECENAKIF